MLLLGQQTQRTCQTLNRRAFVQVGASSVLGLSLANLLRAKESGLTPGSAKAVILVWLWGGPSQLDTFDPKPNAPLEIRGPFATIPTRTPGVRFCELFPKLAGLSDKMTVLRTLSTLSSDHGIAGTIGLTGSSAGGTGLDGKPLPGAPRPAVGSIVAKAMANRGRGSAAGIASPFLVVGGKLHQGKKPIIGEGGGPLGPAYDPFRLEYDPVDGTKSARPATAERPHARTPRRPAEAHGIAVGSRARGRNLGWRLRRSGRLPRRGLSRCSPRAQDARDVRSVEGEREDRQGRYGRTRFGQSCLLARRLVEAGVPFVQVNWSDHVEAEEDSGDGGWDHHYRNFQIMQDRHAMWLDQSLSALLRDLSDRGMLDSTLVLAVGEFGREPKVNDKAGREHWPGCYSALVAGGGVAGGHVLGTSDAKAAKPADTPLTPGDLCATVHHAVGMTSEQIAGMGLTSPGRVIEELFVKK